MRRLVTLLIAASMLVLPCAALAQSAGDEQYADPFGQVKEPNGGNDQQGQARTIDHVTMMSPIGAAVNALRTAPRATDLRRFAAA